MFLSTTLESSMLNVNSNINTTPYDFTIPYDFSAGRNIIISMKCKPSEYDNTYTDSYLGVNIWRGPASSYPDGDQKLNMNIPLDVDTFTGTIKVVHEMIEGSDIGNRRTYTLSVVANISTNTITFIPQSVSDATMTGGPLKPPRMTDIVTSTPVLLNIWTIGATP